jgi:integrase
MTVHRMLKDAVRWDRLARNPADAADPPRRSVERAEINAWDAPTLRQFLDACRAADDLHYALWVFLARTGLRRGEALGLRWRELDLDAGRARITHTLGSISWQVVAANQRPPPVAARLPSIRSPSACYAITESA